MKILKNKVRCKACGEVIESMHRHDFVKCSCENQTMTDGGVCNGYVRRGGVDLSLIEPIEEYISEEEMEKYIKYNPGIISYKEEEND